MLIEGVVPRSSLWFLVVAICCWLYLKADLDESGSGTQEYAVPPIAEFDGFAARKCSLHLLDAGGRAASVYLESLAQRARRHHGFNFDSYSELYVQELRFRLEALGPTYSPREIISQLISQISDSDGWPSLVGDGDIRQAFAAEGSNRKRITRVRAAPAVIEFGLRSGGRALVRAGHLETHLADTGLIRLSGGAVFYQGARVMISADRAVWDIDGNRFYAPHSSLESSRDYGALSAGSHVACIPTADSGFVCKTAESYPRIPPDPLNLAASKIRSNFYHAFGLCETMLGKVFCQSGPLSLER